MKYLNKKLAKKPMEFETKGAGVAYNYTLSSPEVGWYLEVSGFKAFTLKFFP